MKTDEDDNAGSKFDGLIGRDLELETLKQIFENVISNKETGKAAATQVVLISGPTGVGKTALAASLEHLVAQQNGGFFVGKFDELTQLLNPSSACTNAIDSILRGVYEDGRGAELLRVIHDDLADGKFDVEELDRLTTLFPTFATIVREGGLRSVPTSEKDLASNQKLLVSSNAASGMLKESLRLLRKSISRLYRVTVVLFDDLHWADESMLDVFAALTEDATSTSTVFVGTYRDNRTSPAFLRFLQTLQQSRRVALTEIRLEGIGKTCYASLVWAVIGLDEDRITDKSTCRALVDVLYQRSSGYVFYTREFLHVLLSSGMIDSKDGVLSCDITSAKENFGTTLEDILVYKLSKLPAEVLQMLRVSSCMGSTIKEEILELLLQQPIEHVRALLLDALKHGIIVRRATQDENCYLWSFSHDAFKEALYNIMSEADRAKLHHAIGLQLSECWTTSLFLVTSQMLLGAAAMPQASEITTARLCLRAGERATQSSSFWTARDFFGCGIDLLERGSTWDQEYNLFLQLYSAAAEVSYCTGRLNDAHKYADVILRKASCKRDRYRAQAVKLYSFGGRFQTDEAVNYGFSLLKQDFGVQIPRKRSLRRLWWTVHKLKRRIKKTGIETLRHMGTMTDPELLAAMHIMNILFMYCLMDDFERGVALGAKMVDLTLKHGGGPVSFVGFGLIAAVLCNPRVDNIDFGYQLGQVCNGLYDKFSSKTWYARMTLITVVGSVTSKRPIPETFETLEKARRVGLCYGDVEPATACGNALCFNKLEYTPLPEVDELLGECHERLLLYNQHSLVAVMQPLRQFVNCLRSNFGDKCSLLDNDKFDREENKGERVSLWAHTHSMILHFLFSNYEAAYQTSKKARLSISKSLGPNDLAYQAWCDALLCILIARSTLSLSRRTRLRRRASMLIQLLSKLAMHNPHLFLCRQFLLEAEFNIDGPQAHSKFVAAIAQARSCGSMLMIAVINERAARFYDHRKEASHANECFREALQYYDLWGAIAKSQHLRQELSSRGWSMPIPPSSTGAYS